LIKDAAEINKSLNYPIIEGISKFLCDKKEEAEKIQ